MSSRVTHDTSTSSTHSRRSSGKKRREPEDQDVRVYDRKGLRIPPGGSWRGQEIQQRRLLPAPQALPAQSPEEAGDKSDTELVAHDEDGSSINDDGRLEPGPDIEEMDSENVSGETLVPVPTYCKNQSGDWSNMHNPRPMLRLEKVKNQARNQARRFSKTSVSHETGQFRVRPQPSEPDNTQMLRSHPLSVPNSVDCIRPSDHPAYNHFDHSLDLLPMMPGGTSRSLLDTASPQGRAQLTPYGHQHSTPIETHSVNPMLGTWTPTGYARQLEGDSRPVLGGAVPDDMSGDVGYYGQSHLDPSFDPTQAQHGGSPAFAAIPQPRAFGYGSSASDVHPNLQQGPGNISQEMGARAYNGSFADGYNHESVQRQDALLDRGLPSDSQYTSFSHLPDLSESWSQLHRSHDYGNEAYDLGTAHAPQGQPGKHSGGYLRSADAASHANVHCSGTTTIAWKGHQYPAGALISGPQGTDSSAQEWVPNDADYQWSAGWRGQ